MKTVMAFGTFDFLHPGHLFYLKKAKSLGGRLVVVVARDVNVNAIKGKRPLNDEKDRLALVKHLAFVDEAVLGDIDLRKWNVVKRFRPAVIALGYDQWASIPSLRKELEKAGLSPEIVRVKAFKPSKNKSTLMRSRRAVS
ncbi:MAG: adenylyltransferase/cytidyltransferase family protein [archaeon]